MSRKQSAGGAEAIGWMLVALFVAAIAVAFATWALVVATVGGCQALHEAWSRHRGRAHVPPHERFMATWSRGMSPIDQRHWVTPTPLPPSDPRLLPGQLTGALRIIDRGVDYLGLDGPFDQVTFKLTIQNHGTAPVNLADIDDVDLQVWAPNGTAITATPSWSLSVLPPGAVFHVTAAVSIVDRQPISQIAIAHRGANAPYVFFPLHPALAAGHDSWMQPEQRG